MVLKEVEINKKVVKWENRYTVTGEKSQIITDKSTAFVSIVKRVEIG